MRALISYERYTELLSKHIQRTIIPAEVEDNARFEAAHQGSERKFCQNATSPSGHSLNPTVWPTTSQNAPANPTPRSYDP